MLSVICPHCGARGSARRGSSAFVVVGRLGRRLARQCATCAKGLVISFPLRVRPVPDDVWQPMVQYWREKPLRESTPAGYA